MSRTIRLVCIWLSAVFFYGCVAPQPTPEQIAMQRELVEAFKSKIAQMPTQQPQFQQQSIQQQPVQSQTQPIEMITEGDIKRKIDSFGLLNQPISFERKKDGFEVNGIRYIDPEGAIVSYGFDVENGDITYLVKTGKNAFSVKYTRALTNNYPIQVATATRKGTLWNIQTETGQKLSGQSLTPLSCGFLVSRDTVGFIYKPGDGITNIGAPDNFHIATFQNGEVLKTNYLLLEKDAVSQSDSVGSLFDSVKSLGSALGVNKKEDYLLFNVKTGQRVPINVDASGKDVAVRSHCRQVNSIVNECAKIDHFESLFNKYGQPNGTHYFWRINWFAGQKGIYLISEEGTKVVVTNLETGKQIVPFSRTMGVNYVLADRTPDNKIRLRAKLGLQEEEIEDLETYFSTSMGLEKS